MVYYVSMRETILRAASIKINREAGSVGIVFILLALHGHLGPALGIRTGETPKTDILRYFRK